MWRWGSGSYKCSRPHRYLPQQRWIYIIYFLYGEEPLCQRNVMFSWVPFEAKLWKSVHKLDRWFIEKWCLRAHLSRPKAAVCPCNHTHQQVPRSRGVSSSIPRTWQARIKYGEMQNFQAHQRLSGPVIRTFGWLLFCTVLKKSPHRFSVIQWKNWNGLSTALRLSCTNVSRNNNASVLEPIQLLVQT